MSALFLLAVAGSLAAATVLSWRIVELAGERATLVAYSLRFPRGLPAPDVESFIAALSGLLPPWWKRWYGSPSVFLETTASPAGISHQLLVSEAHRHQVENALQAHLPAVAYTPLEGRAEPKVTAAAAYRLSTGDRSLRVDAPTLSRGLLASLQPLHGNESVTIQWALTPTGPVGPARRASQPTRWWWLNTDDSTRNDGEAVTALKAKQSSALLLGVARIGVHADSPKQAQRLLRRVEGPWHGSRAPGVHLRRRLIPSSWAVHAVRRRALPMFAWPIICNSQELAGLIGIPVEAEQIPGLLLGGCRRLAASPQIPTQGVVLGLSTFPGSERPIALDTQAQLRHLHSVGPTGVGKSTLLLNSIIQNLQRGVGVTVLDPKGDLIADVLERIPKHRLHDVIVLDASDDEAPVGLNPLRTAAGNGEVIVENLVGLMHSLWKFSWGPRTDDILRAALLTLVTKPGMSLVEVPALLLQDSFRQSFVGTLDDPVGLESFWGWYEGLSNAERATVVAAPLNKLRAFTMRPRIRRIIGQSSPALDFTEVLADGRIVLINLASGLLGEDAASLLGALVVAELWHATTARAALPPSERRLHVAYLDEFQHFLHLPTPVATVLAEARGLGLGLVLAHQHLHQLPTDIREGVLANARSRVVFQAAASDAHALAKELGGTLTAEDLQGLGGFEIVASVFAGGQVTPPCTARTLPAPPLCSDATAIRARSRCLYGRAAAEIDAEIAARTTNRTRTPVGTTKRSGKGRPGPGAKR